MSRHTVFYRCDVCGRGQQEIIREHTSLDGSNFTCNEWAKLPIVYIYYSTAIILPKPSLMLCVQIIVLPGVPRWSVREKETKEKSSRWWLSQGGLEWAVRDIHQKNCAKPSDRWAWLRWLVQINIMSSSAKSWPLNPSGLEQSVTLIKDTKLHVGPYARGHAINYSTPASSVVQQYVHVYMYSTCNYMLHVHVHAFNIIGLPSDSSASSWSLTLAAGFVGGVLEDESLRLCLFSLVRGEGWAPSSPA